MDKIESHRDLIVWQKAMDMAVLVYTAARDLPSHERFGLSQQVTRSAASVAANIAEGNARGTTRDYAHFLSIARGSLMETETFLSLAVRLDYLQADTIAATMALITEIDRILLTIRRKLLASIAPTKQSAT